MPPVISWLQLMGNSHLKITILPVFATLGYKHCVFVDSENRFGRGPNTLVSVGGPDMRKCLILGTSLLDYLEQYLQRVETEYYSTLRGKIEGFPRDPTVWGGSATTTNGVRIEAVAKFIHFFSRFQQSAGQQASYYFTYQVRITSVEGLTD